MKGDVILGIFLLKKKEMKKCHSFSKRGFFFESPAVMAVVTSADCTIALFQTRV